MFETWRLLTTGDHWTWVWNLGLVPITLFYINAFEWFTHKYILHGLGKNPKSFWNFHWGDHHRNVRKNKFYDVDYRGSLLKWNAQGKEIFALFLGALIHLPVLLLAPISYLVLFYGGLRYYFVHRKSHLDPEWAKTHLPWHVDHHVGSNQNLNWCVTRPWFDAIMGTRKTFK